MKEDKLSHILRSIFTFWNNPNMEELIEKARSFKDMKTICIGRCDGVSINLVNGDIVKTSAFSDFVEGGNDAVYGKKEGENEHFMPENQVWIDANEDINSIPYICFHELWERYQMTDNDLDYEHAHEKANGVEVKLRKIRAFETRRKILQFPRFKQPDENSCGYTSVAMVLQYYGIDKSIEDLKEIYSSDGLSEEEILKILKKLKLKTSVKPISSHEDVKKHIDQNIPIIMCVKTKSAPEGHFVVAIGYTMDHIVFADPSIFYKTYLSFKDLANRLTDSKAIIVDRPNDLEFEREKTIPLE